MRYLGVACAFISLAIAILLGIFGFMGGFGAQAQASFRASGPLEILSALVTIGIIGPLTAQFVEWSTDQQWAEARRHAVASIAGDLREICMEFSSFVLILSLAKMHRDGKSSLTEGEPPDSHQQEIRVGARALSGSIDKLFNTLTQNQVCFTAGMFSVATALREQLRYLQYSIWGLHSRLPARPLTLVTWTKELEQLGVKVNTEALTTKLNLAITAPAPVGYYHCEFVGLDWGGIERDWARLIACLPRKVIDTLPAKSRSIRLLEESHIYSSAEQVRLYELECLYAELNDELFAGMAKGRAR